MIHYTYEEDQKKFGKIINIQAVVEAPIWYIFDRCSATDELLMYSELRINDISKMKDPVKVNKIEIYDEIRFFKGDGPAAQFEAGQQMGGNHLCWICDINSVGHYNYSYSLHRTCSDLQFDKKKFFLQNNQRKKVTIK